MYRWRVDEIFDRSGWVSWQAPGRYRVSYRTCWAPGETRIVITYESDDDFVLDYFTAPV